MCEPIRAEVSPGSKRTSVTTMKPIRVQGLNQLGSHLGSERKPRRIFIGTCMVSTNTCTNIILFTLLQALQYINPIQVKTCPQNTTHPHPFNHNKLIQDTTQYKIQYKPNNARKKIQFPKLRTYELSSEGIHETREEKRGLTPWWPPAPRVVRRPPREAKKMVDLGEREEREWKRVAMEMVFVVGGVDF